MASIIKMYDSLKVEYSKAETELKSVDKNLKKLTGKDVLEKTFPTTPRKNDVRKMNRSFPEEKTRFNRINESNRKRKLSDSNSKIFSRLDKKIDEDDRSLKRPSLQSTIVTTNKAPLVRQKTNEEQNEESNKKIVNRNKRMFGVMMGTLQKFQNEESQRKDTASKREEIEKKLDLADAEEKEAIQKEKTDLIKTKRDKQTQLRKIELQMNRVEIHQQWEKSNKNLANFIQTKTKPHIFYMPVEFLPETEKRLKETKDKYLIILAERRAKVQKELTDIEELYKKSSELSEDFFEISKTENIKNEENNTQDSENNDKQDKGDKANEEISDENSEKSISDNNQEENNSKESLNIKYEEDRNISDSEIKESQMNVDSKDDLMDNYQEKDTLKNSKKQSSLSENLDHTVFKSTNLDEKEFEPIYDE